MDESIFDTIMLCVIGVVMLGACFLIMVVLAYEIMKSVAAGGTRGQVAFAAACYCVVVALFTGFIGGMMSDTGWHTEEQITSLLGLSSYDEYGFPWYSAAAIGFCFAVLQSLISVEIMKMLTEEIKRQKELAPVAAKYALDHFGEFDVNGDKIITKAGVDKVAGKDDDELFAQVRDHFEEFGHVIGHHSETRTTFIYTGKVMVPITTRVVVDDYGINLDDLKSYPQRIAETYKHW